MLSRSSRLVAFESLIVLLLLLTGSSIGHAQDLQGGASRKDLSGGAGSSSSAGGGGGSSTRSRPKVRNTATTTGVKTVARAKTVVVTPTTGTLSVATTESGAAILVEPLRGGEALDAQMEKDERVFVFGNLRPGRYRVAVELDGYTDAEEEVQVLANKNARVTLDLRPITFNIAVSANIQAGEVRYAPVIGTQDANGVIKYNQNGIVSVTPLVNGRATLPNLRPGTYGIDVRAANVGYQIFLGRFTLPGKTTLEVELEKNLSTGTFQALWASLSQWDAPAGWRVASNILMASGRGIALPRNDSFRHYADFRLYASVNMLNGVAASIVVRAQDDKNYYLIQITGKNADEPFVLRWFLVKNGLSQPLGSVSASSFTNTIKQNNPFKITIVAVDNRFKVYITDSDTGELFPLSDLEDTNRNFQIGAAGLAVRDTEQNQIDYFVVCTDVSLGCDKG